VKVVVDRQLCEGHGLCTLEAPEVFVLDDDGSLVVLGEEWPEAMRADLVSAAMSCPTRAITIVD
jgi:ferredoxin